MPSGVNPVPHTFDPACSATGAKPLNERWVRGRQGAQMALSEQRTHIEGDLVDVVEPAAQAARAAEVVQRRPAPCIRRWLSHVSLRPTGYPTQAFPT